MILATIKGKVTNVEPLTTKDKRSYCLVRVLALSDKGQGGTIDVNVWDAKKASEYRKDAAVAIKTMMTLKLFNNDIQANFNVK